MPEYGPLPDSKILDLGIISPISNKSSVDSLGRRVITMENGKIVRDDKSGKYVI